MKKKLCALLGSVLGVSVLFFACEAANSGDDTNTPPAAGSVPAFAGETVSSQNQVDALVTDALEAVVSALSSSISANTRADYQLFDPIEVNETINGEDITGASGTVKAKITGTASVPADSEDYEPKKGDNATVKGSASVDLTFKDSSLGDGLTMSGTVKESLSGSGKMEITAYSEEAMTAKVSGSITESGAYGLSISNGTVGLKLVYAASIKATLSKTFNSSESLDTDSILDALQFEFSAYYKVYD
jgi:hypothetical protein